MYNWSILYISDFFFLTKSKSSNFDPPARRKFWTSHDWKAKVENQSMKWHVKNIWAQTFTLHLLYRCPRNCAARVADGAKIASGSGKADGVLGDPALRGERTPHTRDSGYDVSTTLAAQACSSCCFVLHHPWLDGAAGCFSDSQAKVVTCFWPCRVRLAAGILTSQSSHFTVKDLL